MGCKIATAAREILTEVKHRHENGESLVGIFDELKTNALATTVALSAIMSEIGVDKKAEKALREIGEDLHHFCDSVEIVEMTRTH
jgi:c-di-GMP-related signal transduction protein